MNMYLYYLIHMVLYSLLSYALLNFFGNRYVLAVIFGMTMAILDLKSKDLTSGNRWKNIGFQIVGLNS